MPPVKKNKKQPKASAPGTEEVSAQPEQSLVISGQLDKKIKKSSARAKKERGVVVIRHLPRGFFEEQLKQYFEQFGTVTRLRLARSTRSGGSKGFAFVEFEYPEVAKVAAQTMDNYLMFQKLVKAQYIPPEKQNYNYFKSSVRKVLNKVGRPIYVSHKTQAIQKKAQEYNNWTDEAYQKRIGSTLRKLEKLKQKYAHLGIDFDNFTVKPNIQKIDDKDPKNKTKIADPEETKPEPGSLIKLKKGKRAVDKTESIEPKSKKLKDKKSIELKDLLENTLNEEGSSEDEEWIAEGEDGNTSDEKDYGLESDENDEEEEAKKPSIPIKGSKLKKIDRKAELLKRNTNTGRIQKQKKNLKEKSKKPSSIIMNSLKVKAAKDIKEVGQVKQMKKKDFNKKKRAL